MVIQHEKCLIHQKKIWTRQYRAAILIKQLVRDMKEVTGYKSARVEEFGVLYSLFELLFE